MNRSRRSKINTKLDAVTKSVSSFPQQTIGSNSTRITFPSIRTGSNMVNNSANSGSTTIGSPSTSTIAPNNFSTLKISDVNCSSEGKGMHPINASSNGGNDCSTTEVAIDLDMICDSISEESGSASNSKSISPEESSDLQGPAIKSFTLLDCYVPCLKTEKELSEECRQLGLHFAEGKGKKSLKLDMKYEYLAIPSTSKNSESSISRPTSNKLKSSKLSSYEIDIILNDKLEGKTEMYFVKWKDYSMDSNTWEPSHHLTGCTDLLFLYRFVKRKSDKITAKNIKYFLHDLKTRIPLDILTIEKVLAAVHSEGVPKSTLKQSHKQLLRKINSVTPTQLLSVGEVKLWEILSLSHERKLMLIRLKEWELDINEFMDSSYITVENDVDLQEPPKNFQLINDYMATTPIEIKDDALIGCNCDDCFKNQENCCPKSMEGTFAYDQYGCVKLTTSLAIYECNKLCSCGPECRNRVVQKGSDVKFAIFRTSDGRGWGLKTLDSIKNGQFVIEYLGEIISGQESETREQFFTEESHSYIFDLDLENSTGNFLVDAEHLGNGSHFLNHSCNPNLHCHAVYINQLDARLPRLAFFATRKINSGEELTFDYCGSKRGDKSSRGKSYKIPCKCGYEKCRKFLF